MLSATRNGVWGARNDITRILNSGSTFAEPKFNIRFHEVWTKNSGPKLESIARHIGPEPDVNWLSRLRGILLVAVNKWVNKWIIPQSEQDLFNRLLSKLIKYQVEIGSRPN